MRNVPIDTKLPVRFYDDRAKCDDFAILSKVLFEDETVCLCKIDDSDTFDWVESPYVLFKKANGEVLTDTLQFWYAENFGVCPTCGAMME